MTKVGVLASQDDQTQFETTLRRNQKGKVTSQDAFNKTVYSEKTKCWYPGRNQRKGTRAQWKRFYGRELTSARGGW